MLDYRYLWDLDLLITRTYLVHLHRPGGEILDLHLVNGGRRGRRVAIGR